MWYNSFLISEFLDVPECQWLWCQAFIQVVWAIWCQYSSWCFSVLSLKGCYLSICKSTFYLMLFLLSAYKIIQPCCLLGNYLIILCATRSYEIWLYRSEPVQKLWRIFFFFLTNFYWLFIQKWSIFVYSNSISLKKVTWNANLLHWRNKMLGKDLNTPFLKQSCNHKGNCRGCQSEAIHPVSVVTTRDPTHTYQTNLEVAASGSPLGMCPKYQVSSHEDISLVSDSLPWTKILTKYGDCQNRAG